MNMLSCRSCRKIRLTAHSSRLASLPLLILFFLLSNCSTLNGTRLEGWLGADHDLIRIAYTIADDLERNAFPPLIPRHPDQPILTTTLVNSDDLEETSRFGRIIQEHLASRFVQLGYTVREVKLRNELHIQEKGGETMLSRNLNEIQADQQAQAVAVGTYSLSNRTMYISARMVDPSTSTIVSSADYKLVMDRTMLAMFGLQIKPDDNIATIEEPKPSFITRILY